MEELPVNIDISELISQLQHERLLVNAEKTIIQGLNESVSTNTVNLLQKAWINLQQRVNLNSLVGPRPDCTPEQCCRRAVSLANSIFIDAKEVLDYQVMVNFSNFLSWLRTKPELVAQWIVIGEALSQDQKSFSNILHSIVAGLYGSILLPQDTGLMLSLLQYLAQLQLVTTDNPRRLLKQRSCAFSKMYFLFHEGLISAKLFLIASLQNPIVKLIASSDTYLDIDPSKTLTRFTQSEILEKFGEEGTEEYKLKLAQYRKWIVKNLSDLANLFICSLQDNVYCFPNTLAWLIRQIANMISKSFSPHSKEINAISTDLIFTLFICPAIIQPEPYGICDAPITDIARHNLMQVGQIMQMLALMKFETPDSRLMDLYNMFEGDCISNILDILLNNVDNMDDEMPVDKVPAVARDISLFTESELYALVTFLKRAHNSIVQDQGGGGNEAASTDYCSNNGDNATSPPNDPLVILLNKLPTENEGSPRNTVSNNNVSPTSSSKKAQLLSKAKSHLTRSTSTNGGCDEHLQITTVLVIPLHREDNEHIGLQSEEKVLVANSIPEDMLIDVTDGVDQPEVNGNQIQEKRTRFSLNDEGSIGNTSDNLEVISEGASNHSVASSIELENEDQNDNDNLSDMISANVSGRGTPNISGRDTPSSQVTENEDPRPLAEIRPAYLQQPQPLITKQIRSEIDDKFCKFEIKKLLEGDETISIISDTWSTDVLASDSETIDANNGRHEPPNFASIIEQPDPALPNPLLDVSETQSESAWSTDVLASDTERLTEVDNDDIVSVAPSDDTASVARSDDAASVAPSEIDDQNLNDRRLSTASASNHMINFHSNNTAFQEFRRLDPTSRRESMPAYSTSKVSDMQTEISYSFDRLVIYNSQTDNILRPISRGCADPSKREAILIDGKSSEAKRAILSDISNNIDAAGPSGINKGEPSYILVKNVEQNKYEDFKTDMQLSNTSLNSSSSGSSNGSESQNKNGGTGLDGSWKNKVWMNGSESNLNVTSTPIENTVKKSNSSRSKPSPSTGAIPKSISFDMSAEKTDKDIDDEQKKGRSFFGKFRVNFRPRRGKTYRGNEEYANVRFDGDDDVRYRRNYEYSNGKTSSANTDTSEDILAKYRTKPIENGAISINNILKMEKTPELEDALIGESINIHSLLRDSKKKLRLVLSNSKTQHFHTKKDGKKHVKKDLESFLQIELAKARDLKQWSTAAGVAEALRCVRLLDIAGFNKLCENLRDDYCNRAVYLKYLLRSKQTLLSSQAYLNELFDQVNREKELCASFLVAVCVRLFLEKHERDLQRFCEEFKKLTLVDEKNDHLAGFLTNLYTRMKKDSLWQDASEEQVQLAHVAIERSVMTEVYQHALYPNGDGDRHRDSVLYVHLKKLARTITPGHKYLMINKIYRNECPWLPAQEALQAMAAYRTPRDKLCCVSRCTSAIMDLLALAQRTSTTADDLMPVLVYVIIKANPQDLLSTIQYVNSFYGGNLSGEEGYWWTQFCSAVEFTKTMEYTD